MANPERRRATYSDLLEVPENQVAEIIDGELITQPRPAVPHARAASQLMGELSAPFNRGLVPDLAGLRRERMPEVPQDAAIELAPDWVCEVLSPSTQGHDRVKKMGVYARERVAHVWLVDPLAQTLEVYAWTERAWLRIHVAQGAEKVRATPFEALELDLAALWER
jgi:Uma2 family endonuclease